MNNVLILLQEGSDVNAENKDGNTPLHLCVRTNNMEIARALIAAGAKFRIKNHHYETVTSASKFYQNTELSNFIKNIRTKKEKRGDLQEMIQKYLSNIYNDNSEEEEEEEINSQPIQNIEQQNQNLSSKKEENHENPINSKVQNHKSFETKTQTDEKHENHSEKTIKKEKNTINKSNKEKKSKKNKKSENTKNKNSNQKKSQQKESQNNNNNDYDEYDYDEEEEIDHDVLDLILQNLEQISNRFYQLCQEKNIVFDDDDDGEIEENPKSISDVCTKIGAIASKIDFIDSQQQHTQNKSLSQTENSNSYQDTNSVDNKEDVLFGTGAICDICGAQAIKSCNRCKHKFCEECIGSTQHIEFHLDMD
ncbi:hypothetical protein TRFO_37355 [Tritrichomonas foetus]|uniref:Uncharacterized protein n=1 Tax=Tritrichomonas foetus TaxID=1144522 RepID=A0A1J4JB95_9EUKA|nr:hypothetical protein TRFO_37355 [Tritrichomonas foetus]|eukprot:OHS96466.1 hypothetical protein TRFO_37355 [Tritrichomonas foetus]